MLQTSHSLIGASIARSFPNPFLAWPLAVISHFLADLTPHWDLRTRKTKRSKVNTIFISLTDALIGFSLVFLLFRSSVSLPHLFITTFLAQLPDWLEAPYHIFDWYFPPFSSIKNLQSKLHRKLNLPWGLIYQIIIVTIVVLTSFNLS